MKLMLKGVMRSAVLNTMKIAARPTLLYRSTHPDLTKPPRKLLVIRPDHLGDVLLTTPALRLLRQTLPDTEITALVGPWGAPSLVGNPDIDKLVRLSFPGFSRQPTANPLAPYLLALQQSRILRREGYDAVLNMRYDFWWGALLAYLSDIPARFGFDWDESRAFLNCRLSLRRAELPKLLSPFGQPPQHFSALSLSLAQFMLNTCGVKTPSEGFDASLKFCPSPEEKRYVNLILSEMGLERNDKLVAIHPGTGANLKLWTVEGFAGVADAISHKYNAKVVLVGGEKEAILVKNILRHCQNTPIRLDSGDNWGKLAALFERSQLVIGLDSGPMHLAVAMGAPTLHLFGPTDPQIFGPWGDPQKHRLVRTEIDLPCCPCGVLDPNRICWKGGYCMRTIKVTQVLGEVARFL
ncbi:glycosyltransferase family 9 protein [Candidatus Chlorohelix sp.]|uniref:glycosyltransferase family 9 protein n=1 Tax=Candidatus Chlorohelix sp. TaxID=3139201 RepID=UPI0030401062